MAVPPGVRVTERAGQLRLADGAAPWTINTGVVGEGVRQGGGERGRLIAGLKKLFFRSQRFIDQPHGVDHRRRARFGLAGLESFFIQANGPFP